MIDHSIIIPPRDIILLMDKIKFDDFAKVEMKTGKILSAEAVEGSEKLLKLMVDIGEDPSNPSGREIRQILAGIAKFYTPDELVGRTVIIAANLEPRMMMGLESQGMLLAADGEKPVPLTTSEPTDPGSAVR